jgi:surfactin synthase thioesterase subunit
MKLFIISGLSANQKVFDKIQFPAHLELIHLPWIKPNDNESLKSYALRMLGEHSLPDEYCLLGYSFGGLIAQMLHSIKPAKKIVILASMKTGLEKNSWLSFLKFLPLYRLFPARFFAENKLISWFYFRKLKNQQKLKAYFEFTNPEYVKWSINQIIQWQPHQKSSDVVQIQGDHDAVFPNNYGTIDHRIAKGNHLFPIFHADKVSEILAQEYQMAL